MCQALAPEGRSSGRWPGRTGWDASELSYQPYGQEHAGQGYTTEAVRLLVDYLFGAKMVNRISLVIVPWPPRRFF